MKRVLLLSGILIALGGCSTIEELYTDVPKEVAIAQQTLATADHVAVAYFALPVCGKTSATLCKNPATEQTIAAAEQKAFTLVEAAYQAESQDAVDAANTALSAFSELINNPTVAQATAAN